MNNFDKLYYTIKNNWFIVILKFIVFYNVAYSENDYQQIKKLTLSDRAIHEEFGGAVAISGDYAIVGASYDNRTMLNWQYHLTKSAGKVIIYKRNGNDWEQHQELVLDLNKEERFGSSVSISGEYLIIGAIYDGFDENDENYLGINNYIGYSGAAYVYKLEGDTWIKQQKLIPSNRGGELTGFGRDVAIDGENIIVSTYGGKGKGIYYFKLENNYWVERQIITQPDEENDWLGESISISGNYFIVSSSNSSLDENGDNFIESAGAAYIFKFENDEWSFHKKFVSTDREFLGGFGSSVAISENYAIIGAIWESYDIGGNDFQQWVGGAYILKLENDEWFFYQKVFAEDKGGDDFFGSSVAISNDFAIIGAEGNDIDDKLMNNIYNSGAAYIFRLNNSIWTQEQKLVASDRIAFDYFGSQVALSDNNFIVGAAYSSLDKDSYDYLYRAGAAYIYGIPTPTRQTKEISFNKIGKNQFGIRWKNGNGTKRIIIASELPLENENYISNGKSYNAGDYGQYLSEVNDVFVVYNGNGKSCEIKGLKNNTTYHLRAFEYNGSKDKTVYFKTNANGNPRSNITLRKELDDNSYMKDNAINIFPNPVKNVLNLELNIHFDNGEILIIDNEGKEIYKYKELKSLLNINVSDFNNGTYHVLVSNGEEAFYKSFIISN